MVTIFNNHRGPFSILSNVSNGVKVIVAAVGGGIGRVGEGIARLVKQSKPKYEFYVSTKSMVV